MTYEIRHPIRVRQGDAKPPPFIVNGLSRRDLITAI